MVWGSIFFFICTTPEQHDDVRFQAFVAFDGLNLLTLAMKFFAMSAFARDGRAGALIGQSDVVFVALFVMVWEGVLSGRKHENSESPCTHCFIILDSPSC